MRDPSIHIRRSKLKSILENILPQGVLIDELVDHVMREAKSVSVTNRLFIESNKAHERKVENLKKSSRDNTALMAKLIFIIRKKLKHKGVELIKAGSKDWVLVKSVTEKADLFCEDFGLPLKEGYTEYIKVGLSFMYKFRITTLPSLYPSICERYAAIQRLKTDSNPELTKKAHDYYRIYISKVTGVINNYEAIPEKYVLFMDVVEFSKKFGVSIKSYLDAQLEYFLDKLGNIPAPEQLITDKAKIRLNSYLIKK